MTYGWMPPHDYATMDKTLELVCAQFPDGIINSTELGVRDGRTSIGIHQFFSEKHRTNFHTGIDNGRDMEIKEPFPGCNLIIGNSIEVYYHLRDNSQHFLFFDASHAFPMVVADFFCYQGKIKKGGYAAFHDTGKQIPLYKDYQGMGDKGDPDMFISCRKALDKIGLLNDTYPGWKLIFDEFDPNHDTGGIVVVQKL